MKQRTDSYNFKIPTDTYFSKRHTWIRKNDYGLLKLGLDEIIWKINEDLRFGNFVKIGTSLKKDDPMFEVAAGPKRYSIESPIAGVPVFYNPFIFRGNFADPYDDDWIILIRANDFLYDKKFLMSCEEYKNWIDKMGKKSLDESFTESP